MSSPEPANAALCHPWRALLISVAKVLVAWLFLTTVTIAMAWPFDGEIRRPRRAVELEGIDTPLWLRLTIFACLARLLTPQGRRFLRLPMVWAVLAALGTCLQLGSAFYDLECVDWRIALCGFWAVVVATFTERHLRFRYRMLARGPGTPA